MLQKKHAGSNMLKFDCGNGYVSGVINFSNTLD